MADNKKCTTGGQHDFPDSPKFNQVVKCPACGHMYAWFGFWAEIG